MSVKISFVLSNSADPDEMPNSLASHHGLHCQYIYLRLFCIERVNVSALDKWKF